MLRYRCGDGSDDRGRAGPRLLRLFERVSGRANDARRKGESDNRGNQRDSPLHYRQAPGRGLGRMRSRLGATGDMLDGIRLVEVGETSVFVDVPLTRVVGVAVVHAKRRLFRLL